LYAAAWYVRVGVAGGCAADTPAVPEFVPALILAALLDSTALYAITVSRRVHARRVSDRVAASARLYGIVRVTLADRRAATAA
jgi:hypothetical protein